MTKPVLLAAGNGTVKRLIDRFVWHQTVEVEHPQSAIRQGDFKLLNFWDTKEGLFFDLSTDLGETRDVAKAKPEIAAQLETELKAHVRAGLGEQVFAALERGEFPPSRGPAKGKGPPKKGKAK